jgi:hypothetical protein
MPLAELRRLSIEVSELLCAVRRAGSTGPRLIFPTRRAGNVRVSEQEAKVLLCQLLDRSQWFYSVETPTKQTYKQKGKTFTSGRSDISLYATNNPADKRANIELKAHGKINVEDFRKDFEKVLREDIHALWFHTLESIDRGTFKNVFRKMLAAFSALMDEIDGRTHTIVFAFCVLSRSELWLTSVTLSGSALEQLQRLRGTLDHTQLTSPPSGGWAVHRFVPESSP